jgi:integrase
MRLTLRKDGRYAAKVAGKYMYFGRDKEDATHKYTAYLDQLRAGEVQVGFTVGHLLDQFRHRKTLAVQTERIKEETFDSYVVVMDRVAKLFRRRLVESLTPADFDKLRASLSASVNTTRSRLGIARMIFFFANESGQLEKPLRYRDSLKTPSAKELRLARVARGPRLLTAKEIQTLVGAAESPMRSMILLGINAGLGNNDCALLTADKITGEWLEYARPKTGNPRRCWLWPETRAGLAVPFDEWTTERVSKTFSRLARSQGIRRTFYDLRRTMATVGFATGLRDATSFILGHVAAPSDMGAVYRQIIPDDQIRTVSEHVRNYVLGRVTLNSGGVHQA